jgi:6-pyruvoyltetrahydropterin/6-carboxytetrahydropterin synthase
MKLYFDGELDDKLGWVMDFSEIKMAVAPVIKRVDHKLINDIEGLENPTCEIFAQWFWNEIKPLLPQLTRVELHENPTSGAIYEGE